MKLNKLSRLLKLSRLSTHPNAGGLMKLQNFPPPLTNFQLSTHPNAGGLMKPRPLKLLST